MTLAKDEKLGLAVAAFVGAAALATFAYRQTWSTGPAAPEEPEPPPAPEPVNAQEQRDDFARHLQDAFASANERGTTRADGTTLMIAWEMCSKQMVHRLLHDAENLQVKGVRDASGITGKKLKALGFKKVVCDDGRKGLAPSTTKL